MVNSLELRMIFRSEAQLVAVLSAMVMRRKRMKMIFKRDRKELINLELSTINL